MQKNIKILLASDQPDPSDRALREQFTVVELPENARGIDTLLLEHGAGIRGIGVRRRKIDAEMIRRLPALEIISSYSAGLERVGLAAAERRGIVVCNTSKVLAEDVADLALYHIIATARRLVESHNFTRAGRWAAAKFPLGRSVRSLKVGIVGLGHIGSALARRIESIGAEIAYFGPRSKPVPYLYFSDIQKIANWADTLVVCCPAVPATHHLINQSVIEQLGPNGFVVNISRGSVIDEQALIAALENHTLAGAGLDVFQHEPLVPEGLLNNNRAVLTPHLGSATEETRKMMGDTMVEALKEHFSAA